MDFFEHQDRARRSTGRLVLLFIIAVILIVALVDVIVVAALASGEAGEMAPVVLVVASVMTIFVIVGGSLYKLSELKSGGRYVAERMGGRLLNANSRDLDERRLLNVVEEMAIASGTPVPPVYVMDNEKAINAFAAGYSPDDAVIGVTRGTLELLPRDELQGVIAHEFSHILNGDMRLNIKLIGVLHGIILLSLIGNVMFRIAFYTGGARRSRRSKDEGNLGMALLLIGLGLMIVGSIGSFFGSLIRSSVSRQREFLADASAVQFTRNPSGIADALKRIGGHAQKAYVENENAVESAHMFFGSAVHIGLASMFATHPPLPVRIARVEPNWDGKFIASEPVRDRGEEQASKQGDTRERQKAVLGAAVVLAGVLTEDHIEHAAVLASSIPDDLKNAAREPFGARAAVCALLLSRDERIRKAQLEAAASLGGQPLVNEIVSLAESALALPTESRIPLLDIALPSLRSLSISQMQSFDREVTALVEADGKLGLFEWALQRILRHSLAEGVNPTTRRRISHYGLQQLAEPAALMLSTLAYAGHESPLEAQASFRAAWRALDLGDRAILPLESCSLRALDVALDALDGVAPKVKKQLIEAAGVCVVTDSTVTTREGELLRAMCEALGVPMPPILPGQPLV